MHLAFYRRRGRSLTRVGQGHGRRLGHGQGQGPARDADDARSARIRRPTCWRSSNAGLDDEAIEAIQQAIAASIDRSLTLSAQLQVSALRDDQALFAYDIDLSRLDAAGKAAVGDALHGQLAAIDGQAAA